ncbi:MAG: ATP-binding cassette domain-containing protein [Acidobacteriota bacterium]
MIQLVGVSRRHARVGAVLSDVTTVIEPAEMVFLTGPSGAGKTTLLRLIFREESTDAGKVLVFGRDVARLSEAEVMAHRRDVGFVFQDFRLLPQRTVLDNLTFVQRALGTPRSERTLRAFDALSRVGMQHALRSLPRELSGGEQQRVAIARAIIGQPRLLLADEPTGSLDQTLATAIFDLFTELNAAGTTVVLATHDLEQVRRVGRRTLVLERGRLVSDGDPR